MKIQIMPYSKVSRLSPGRIALGYAVIAILWIAFSDALVTFLKLHPAVNTIKGGVFVFVTAALLYFTIRRLVWAVQLTSQERDETAELYRTVVEASNEGICLLDESGRISFLNRRLAAMLGRPAEELQGKRLQDFIEEPHVLAQPGAQQSETRECRLRKDSDPKPWVLISRRPILNDAGEVVRLVVTVTDISERKRAEKAPRRSAAYVAEVPGSQENLAESQLAGPARYGLAILAVGIALAAALLLRYFHFRDAAIPLLLFAIAISSWFGGRGPAIFATILSTISFYWYFIEPVRTIYIYWSNVPYFIIFVAFATLISWFATIRRRVEAGLHEQAALLNLTHDTVFVMDMEGVITYWNRGAEERYGWPAEKAVGKVVHDLLKTVFPKPLEEIKSELIRTDRWEGELVHSKKDGTQVTVASRWSLQRDRHGAPFAILETNNDISERKRAEQALSRSNRQLRAISECNQALLRATDEQRLLEQICRIVCEEAGYRMAWVGYAEHDEAKSVRPVAWTGAEEGYLAIAGLTWADTERGRGPSGTAIRSGQACCVKDFATDPRMLPWRESVQQRGFLSGIGLPLKDEDANTFGCLAIYSSQPDAFSSQEIRLLEELADDLAFGIVTLRSRAARKRAEEEITLLSFALNKVRETALLIDDTARFHYVNEEGCRVLGYTRAELLGMGVPDIDPEFPVGRWSDHWRDLKAQRSLSFESRHRTKDGRIFPVEVSANYFEYGGRAYNLALVRDITERKRAQEALEQERRLFISGPNVAYRVRATEGWPLEYVSPNMKDEFGYVPEALVREKVPAARLIHPDDLPRVAKEIEARSNAGESYFSLEFRIVHANGACRWAYDFVVVRRDENGLITHYYGYLTDITERKRAEEAVRRTTAYLAETQTLTHTGTWVFDPTTEPLYWSEELFRIFGFDPQQGLPTREQALQRIHPEDRSKFMQAFDKTIREKADAEAEYRIVLPDGTLKWAHGIGHPVCNDNDELVEVVGTTSDITERKRAEEALRESETRFRTFWDHAADAFAVFDEQHKIIDVNREACEIGGYTREEVIGMVPQDFDPDVDAAMLQRIEEQIEAGEICTFQSHNRRKDGTVFPVEVRVRPFWLGGRRLHLAVSRDITERKRAEEELHESETRFRTFVDHTGDALIVYDPERRTIVDVNRSACESLGYTRQELVGNTPLVFHLDSYAAEMESAEDHTAAGEALVNTHVHRRKDGSTFPVEVHTSQVTYGGRRFLLTVARDITDRLQAEEQRERLHQLEVDIAHLDRLTMLGELTASIAHEVNQPLSGVVSNGSACLRWLAGDVPNLEEAREATRRIVRDGKRAGEVIARVRALTKKASTPREKLDLNETLRQVLALVGDEAKRKRVDIRTKFADDLSPVSGDQVQLQQVVLNLAMNAIEAMSNVGERARELVITTGNIDTDQVQVTVEDSGVGLDPNTMQKIFEPFYTTKPTGMGMGLSISRSILQSHGGRLWATAKDGAGTIFYFTLPKYHEEKSNAAVSGV